MPLRGVPVTGAGLLLLRATKNLAVSCLPEPALGVLSPSSAREEGGEELLQSRKDSERPPWRVALGSEEGLRTPRRAAAGELSPAGTAVVPRCHGRSHRHCAGSPLPRRQHHPHHAKRVLG